jgi:hypothetical protein
VSRQLGVRTVLRLAAVALAVTLTVALSRSPASGAWTAATSGTGTVGTAASFCTAPGIVDVPVTNDAWTDQAAPGTAHATSPALSVQSGAGADQRTFLRFAVTAPPRCDLAAAQLRLYNRAPTAGRVVVAYLADPAQSPQWTAGALTWGTQPGVSGAGSASATPTTAGLQTWDVTAQTRTLVGGPNNGFVLVDDQEGQTGPFAQSYDEQSTPGGTVPVLRLTWS